MFFTPNIIQSTTSKPHVSCFTNHSSRYLQHLSCYTCLLLMPKKSPQTHTVSPYPPNHFPPQSYPLTPHPNRTLKITLTLTLTLTLTKLPFEPLAGGCRACDNMFFQAAGSEQGFGNMMGLGSSFLFVCSCYMFFKAAVSEKGVDKRFGVFSFFIFWYGPEYDNGNRRELGFF